MSDATENQTPTDGVTLRRVVRLWLPLAGSWLMMGAEGPLCFSFIAEEPDETAQLAAFGSLAYPVSMLIEAPVIMLLAASTRMATDRCSWRRLALFANVMGLALTLLHSIVAFTPWFDVIATDWIELQPDAVEPARAAMQCLVPWSWAIAWRRLQQGLLIRNDTSRPVAVGTVLRLIALFASLSIGMALAPERGWHPAAVGAASVSIGVIVEALFIDWAARRLALPRLSNALPERRWSWGEFARFYVPLASVPYLAIVIHPAGAWTIARMPEKESSLAIWGPVTTLIFIWRSGGFAFNEVVVSMIGRSNGPRVLRTFAWRYALFALGGLLAMVVTPLGRLWFEGVQNIEPELAAFALAALCWGLTQPIAGVYMNLFQGALVAQGRTRAVTEGVAIYAITCLIGFAYVRQAIDAPGVPAVLVVIAIAQVLQVLWVAVRSGWARSST